MAKKKKPPVLSALRAGLRREQPGQGAFVVLKRFTGGSAPAAHTGVRLPYPTLSLCATIAIICALVGLPRVGSMVLPKKA